MNKFLKTMGTTLMAIAPIVSLQTQVATASSIETNPLVHCVVQDNEITLNFNGESAIFDSVVHFIPDYVKKYCALPTYDHKKIKAVSYSYEGLSEGEIFLEYGQLTLRSSYMKVNDIAYHNNVMVKGIRTDKILIFATDTHRMKSIRLTADEPIYANRSPSCRKIGRFQYEIDYKNKSLYSRNILEQDLKADFSRFCRTSSKVLKDLRGITFSLAAEIENRQARGPGQRVLGSHFWILSGEESPRDTTPRRGESRGLIEGRGPIDYSFPISPRQENDVLIAKSIGYPVIYKATFVIAPSVSRPKPAPKKPEPKKPSIKKVKVTCESKDFEKTVCPVKGITSVRLISQQSSADCKKGESFFKRKDKIVVKKGCRGIFEATVEI